MKIFLDTAHVESIKKWVGTGLIDGVTTNPSHLSKEAGLPVEVIREICALLPEGYISVEVTEADPRAVYEQAHKIAAIADNIVIKVPCHLSYFSIIKKLIEDDLELNITLIFSTLQALAMAKLGVQFVSPFVGRIDDIGGDGIQLVREIKEIFTMNELETEVLAASLRTVGHMQQAVLAGADAVTVPVEVFEKSMQHVLTDKGMAQFNADWQKLGIKQFP